MSYIGNSPDFQVAEGNVAGNLSVSGNVTITGDTNISGDTTAGLIKASNIKHASSSTNNIVLHSNGTISQPSKLCAFGYFASGTTGNANRNFDSISLNNGFTITTSPGKITVPQDGAYLITFSQLIDTGSAGVYLRCTHNGTIITYGYLYGGLGPFDCGSQCIVDMSASDYIQFYMANTPSNTWSGGHSQWSISFLG